MRLLVTCLVVSFASVLVGLMAMFLSLPLGLVPAFAIGPAVAGLVGYFILRERRLTAGRAGVMGATCAVAFVAAVAAASAGFDVREHREHVREAKRDCRQFPEIRRQYKTFDACVDAHVESLEAQD